ncbi:apolipoprotein N-acyltransferase [Nocardioides marmotae]|uniref:apolipoprotein N-acyltransferase n=1 Tax=Nocardioides marmotae TaxID=2663857 RepID=UPI001321250D|nr:apolipoprotein N-acyltransferase [Nocardioides marmotae]MBC9733894.1 apolipoprotein N-acyltransferase [Nocardioides marmotae]MTB84998.1 apolipoprotein N-acyltransferase [Nocardioides marmotae]
MLKRCLVALVAGVLLAAAFEPVAAAYLLPVAVAGFALATRGLRARSGFVVGLVFGVAFYFPHISWMTAVGTDAWLALAGVESLFYGLLGAAAAYLHRLRAWPLWLAAAWVTVEVWRSGWPFSGMPWGRLSFAVADTPVAPALAYVGMVGVSFLLALLGFLLAALVLAVARARDRRALVAGAALAGVALLSVLPAAVPFEPATDETATVAAVQGDVPGPGNDILYDFRGVTDNHVEATVDLAEQVAAGTVERPDFVVWPENSTAVDPFADASTNAGIRRAVEAIGVPVLVGAIVDAGQTNVLNQGIVWDPVTGPGERYTKWHPVPYGEYIPFREFFTGQFGRLAMIPRDMMSGTRETPLEIAGTAVGDAICFDVAYDDGIQAQVRNGAEMLTVQTSNATFIETDQIEQQFAITRLRAIETGKTVVVAATNGVSGIIGPDGGVVASAAPRTQEVLVAEVGLWEGTTPGVLVGPWVGRLAAIATGIGLLLSVLAYRRGRGTTAPRNADEASPDPRAAREDEEQESVR